MWVVVGLLLVRECEVDRAGAQHDQRLQRLHTVKPRARRMINLIFALNASACAFDSPKRTASKIPSRCARIVRPNLTNSAIRLRAARDRNRSNNSPTS